VLNELVSHSRRWFNTLIQRSRTVSSVAYTVFVLSRLSAPVELYHSRHNGRDRQYECDCEIRCGILLTLLQPTVVQECWRCDDMTCYAITCMWIPIYAVNVAFKLQCLVLNRVGFHC